MHIPKQALWIILGALMIFGCSPASTEPAPTFLPTPSTSNLSTGSSPLSGDWNATTEFGRLAFTVDPNGATITTLVVSLINWTCGGTTLTAEIQELSPAPIRNDTFSSEISLKTGHSLDMSLEAKYDKANKKFTGTWEEDAYSTKCSGKWESSAHK